jgi:hypothetical protein
MKTTTCPKCSHQFPPIIDDRSVTGLCTGCGHELGEEKRFKRCQGCRAKIRLYCSRYQTKKKLSATKQEERVKQASPWLAEDKKLQEGVAPAVLTKADLNPWGDPW